MKYLWKISLILALLTLLFVGCGGGGAEGCACQKPVTLPKCNDTNSSNGYLIKTDGNITKVDENTTLQVWHFANGDKVVCVNRGKAMFTPIP